MHSGLSDATRQLQLGQYRWQPWPISVAALAMRALSDWVGLVFLAPRMARRVMSLVEDMLACMLFPICRSWSQAELARASSLGRMSCDGI